MAQTQEDSPDVCTNKEFPLFFEPYGLCYPAWAYEPAQAGFDDACIPEKCEGMCKTFPSASTHGAGNGYAECSAKTSPGTQRPPEPAKCCSNGKQISNPTCNLARTEAHNVTGKDCTMNSYSPSCSYAGLQDCNSTWCEQKYHNRPGRWACNYGYEWQKMNVKTLLATPPASAVEASNIDEVVQNG